MPGYEVTPVEPLKPGFLCGECTLLLRDPVQTEDGDRLCLSCTEAIRSTGPSTWGGKKLGEVSLQLTMGSSAVYSSSTILPVVLS